MVGLASAWNSMLGSGDCYKRRRQNVRDRISNVVRHPLVGIRRKLKKLVNSLSEDGAGDCVAGHAYRCQTVHLGHDLAHARCGDID